MIFFKFKKMLPNKVTIIFIRWRNGIKEFTGIILTPGRTETEKFILPFIINQYYILIIIQHFHHIGQVSNHSGN